MKFDEKEVLSFAKKVQKFINLHGSEPDQKLCPTPYIKWQTKVGTNYKNLLTGKKYNILEHKGIPNSKKDNTHWYRANSGVLIPYVKLDKRLGVAEISMITIDTHIRGDARKFEFCGARHFMSIDNPKLWAERYYGQIKVVTDNYLQGCPYSFWKNEWYCTPFKITTYLSRLSYKGSNSIVISKLKEILKINNVQTLEYWGTQHDINEIGAEWQFAIWVEKFGKKPQKRSAQMQDTIGMIEKTKLPDIDVKINKKLQKTEIPVTIYCDNIEDIVAFRIYRPVYLYTSSYTGRTSETYYRGANDSYLRMEEMYRIFLNQKNTLVYRRSGDTKWEIEKCVNPLFNVVDDIRDINYNYQFRDVEKIINMPQFKYLKDILNNQEINLITLLNARQNKNIEKLLKMGCVNIANILTEYNTTKANIKCCFGETNAKHKDITKIMGMSINQIKKYESVISFKIKDKIQEALAKDISSTQERAQYQAYQKATGMLYGAKYLYAMYNILTRESTENNISCIDIPTFENMLNILTELIDQNIVYPYRNGWYGNYYLNQLIFTDKNGIDRVKDLIKTRNMCKEANLSLKAITDIKNIYNGLLPEYRPENLDLQPKCASDIMRIHDTLIELQNISDQERRRRRQLKEEENNRLLEKQMEKFQEKRRENLYEDDKYIITIPEKLSELSEEGVTQRICIGSYINSYAEGRGNIYFLRKKEDPKKPFFAIEEKNGNIVQIHGYCNKWLGADDESFAAVPFVMRWLKKCGFTCKKEILTCRSIGYHQTNNYRELPTI